jgi:hypothetical protein
MSIPKAIKRLALSVLVAVGVMSLSVPAQAAMVGTGQIVGVAGGQTLDPVTMQQKRDWIQVQLEEAGISPADSALRVSSMSDEQVIQIHKRMDEMPAGAGIAGTILLILAILAVTDYMGVTDIYPFIRPREK